MASKALLFGSIGVLAETSDIQRRAYNQAFIDKGLSWHWDSDTYRYLLQFVGGQARMRLLSDATGAQLTDALIQDIHAHKTQLAGDMVQAEVSAPRPGVHDAIAAAKQAGVALGIVTSTQRANIDAVAGAAGIDLDRFDVIIGQADITKGKPDPEPYQTALARLGVDAADALAIEDTASSVNSAIDAGITTYAVPGAYARGQDFRLADKTLPSLLGDGGALAPSLRAFLAAPAVA
ncbi:MAG: HAD-IA family hydrolase [Pseudomonadota bacterium]